MNKMAKSRLRKPRDINFVSALTVFMNANVVMNENPEFALDKLISEQFCRFSQD